MRPESEVGIGRIPESWNLRLETLVRIRWLAIVGQTVAVLVVWKYLGFEFSPLSCFPLIVISALLNIFLSIRFPASHRLDSIASTMLLAYDIVQLAMLLFVTGGLQNPFSILLLVPVVISASMLPVAITLFLGFVAVTAATILVFFHQPLPWFPGFELQMPRIYVAGLWVAIISSMFFMAIYAFRVADEARKLSEALAATELVLQREQHLSNIDGLAAAAAHELGTPLATIALVSKEMMRELDGNETLQEDAKLLRSQAERCREILRRLSSLSTQDAHHFGKRPFSAILEEVSEPHRPFGIDIEINTLASQPVPTAGRNPAIIYGLGNIVENAVDHARSKVVVNLDWNDEHIQVSISDDGNGFEDEILERIGEPFVSRRRQHDSQKGLGLGLFIAKTLLERSGASLVFSNNTSQLPGGARIVVSWPREIADA